MDWQPIESAPKDGTPVLLFDPVFQRHIGSFVEEWYKTEYVPEHRTYTRQKWVCWSNRTNLDFKPTHWMPLPEPPTD